jgi:hypothetical protein
MALRVTLDILLIPVTAWFWSHCAEPALTFRDASRLAHRLVFVATLLMIAASGVAIAGEFAMVGRAVAYWISSVLWVVWVVVVGLGYFQDYRFLRQATRRRA